MDPELATRLERLEAAEQVRSVVAAYCQVLDETRNIDELGELFAPDAVLRNPGEHKGRDAILGYYQAFFDSGVGISRHHVVNETVTIQEDGRARFSAYFLVLLARDGRSFVGFGNYEDLLERVEGSWRFAEKRNQVLRMVPLEDGWT